MAEQSLVKLMDTLFPDDSTTSANTKKLISSSDLLQLIRSDDSSIQLGLRQFYSILKAGLRDLGDGKLAFQSWTDPQIQAVCSIAHAIAFASRSLTGTLCFTHELFLAWEMCFFVFVVLLLVSFGRVFVFWFWNCFTCFWITLAVLFNAMSWMFWFFETGNSVGMEFKWF